MTCEERKELLLLYATGALEPAEEAALREHLSRGCPACAGGLAEAEATVHQLPKALTPEPAPEGAWEKIEARIALKEQLAGTSAHEPDRTALAQPFVRRSRARASYGWSVAAIVAVVMGIALAMMAQQMEVLRGENDRLAKADGLVQEMHVRVIELQQQIDANKRDYQLQIATATSLSKDMQTKLEKFMRSEQYAVAGPEQPNVQGKIFVDKVGKTVTLAANNVKALPKDKTYELWIIPADGTKPLAAGTLSPDATGKLIMEAPIPENVQLATAAVTIEDVGGSATPTMPIQFLGSVKQ